MSESVVDPCAWPITPGPCCQNLPPDTDPAVIQAAIQRASAIMRALSGNTIGQCIQTLRPLHQCPTCRSSCCGGADGIALAGWDGEHVSEVLSVMIGPDLVDPNDYWFDGSDQMLWRNPPDRWPNRDPKWQPCGDGGAFCVEVLAGQVPDSWALQVADELVCELVKACTGQKCRLPRNISSVTAQGVTVNLTPEELAGLLPEVGNWASTINPAHAVLPAMVWSPDTAGGRIKREGVRRWWR